MPVEVPYRNEKHDEDGDDYDTPSMSNDSDARNIQRRNKMPMRINEKRKKKKV